MTLGDVSRLFDNVRFVTAFFGSSPEFTGEFNRRIREIGRCVRRECSLTPEEAIRLGKDFELPLLAEMLFLALKEWCEAQHDAFVPD